MNRPLFPMSLSIPSYNIRKYVGLRTYQYPLYIILIKSPEQKRPLLKSSMSVGREY